MKKLLILFLFLAITTGIRAQDSLRPRLVVGIVIDQMRWDYLYNLQPYLGNGGFKRLMQRGYNCDQTYINYLPSYTGPGHACIYTGTVPAIHGIAGNDWIERKTGGHMYVVYDADAKPLGGSVYAGRMSPRNLWTSTITDELKLATGGKSKVIGISIKDRGAILTAGHSGDGAYWFDDSTGSFISSDYYHKILPDWVTAFNLKKRSDYWLSQTWKKENISYGLATEDSNRYEGLNTGEQAPVFPHQPTPGSYYDIRKFPWGNNISIEMAAAALENAGLGKDNITDFLCLSLSSTDYIGHQYGPNAQETIDCYVKIDRLLEEFLNKLDQEVGKGNYLLFLTADHGAAHNNLFLEDKKIPAGNYMTIDIYKDLNKKIKEKTGTDSLVLFVDNSQIYLNEQKIKKDKADRRKLKQQIMQILKTDERFLFVADLEKPQGIALPQPLQQMLINGITKDRSGCIQFIMKPGWYDGYRITGTTHGAWNPYDTHIPLLWYGWHVKAGSTKQKVEMTDIAATLAALLHIQEPNGCIGTPILELFQ